MGDEYLRWMLDTMGPEALQAYIESGLFNEQMGLAGQDWSQGQSMTETPGAQGMRVGGTYVASSPLEHASVALARAMGGQKMDAARSKQAGFMDKLNASKLAMLNAMGGQAPTPYTGQVPQPVEADPWMGVPYR